MSRITDLIASQAETRGDTACFIDAGSGAVLTYDDLALDVASCQSLDTRHRLRAGPVGLVIAGPVTFARTFLALLSAGFTIAPLDPATTSAGLDHDIRDLRLTTLVSDRPDLPTSLPTFRPFDWVRPGRPPRITAVSSASVGSVVLRSSGTTGRRKQILLPETQLLHTAYEIAQHHELTPDDRGFSPLPLFHVNAEVVGLLATLVAGASLVLGNRFHRSAFWLTVGRHRVTWLNAVPAILAILALEPPPYEAVRRIRFARSASAPLAPAVLDRFETTTGIPVLETYGMTEAASQITANPLSGPRRKGSVGLPVGCELRVRAGDRTCAPGQAGTVHIRGAGVIPGPLPGGWLDTGDLGYVDGDGYLFLTGRADDVINRGGEKLLPRTIEDVALGDPDVAAAVAVGVPDPILGSVPVLFAQPTNDCGRRDAGRLADRLRTRCEEQLPGAHRPARIDVVESLPLGATGKLSHRLVQAAEADLARQRWASA